MIRPFPVVSNQRGIALVIAMLVLLVLSLIAVVLMSTITTERKVGAHSARESAALDIAEAGVAEACSRLRNQDIVLSTLNPRAVAQIFNCAAGSVPVLGVDSTGYATAQSAGQWLRYSNATRGATTLTIKFKTDAAKTVIYKYDYTQNPAVQTTTGTPIYVITSTGRVGADQRSVVAEVMQKPIIVAVNGGVGSGLAIQFTGSAEVCGYNHRADTPTGTSGRAAGVGNCNANLGASPPQWEWPTGAKAGAWSTGSATPGGSATASGTPSTSSGNPSFFNGPWETIGMTQAEFYNWVGTPSASMPGSPNGIIYLDNDGTKQNASGSWSGTSGTGLLYADGNLTLNSSFTWRGLIYCEGDLTLNGGAWVLGAVVARGTSNVKFNGSATVLYSYDAIQNYITKYGGKFTNLSWREL